MTFVFIVFVILFIFVVPGIFRWLWNMTCPQLFHWPEIEYWQAFRLIVMAGIVFGGWHYTASSTGGWGIHL